jgi:hypothetical protein
MSHPEQLPHYLFGRRYNRVDGPVQNERVSYLYLMYSIVEVPEKKRANSVRQAITVPESE